MNMIIKPRATVSDMYAIEPGQTFTSKSGGTLTVPFKMSPEAMARFLQQDSDETIGLPDIRGFRIYKVSGIKKGAIGGIHFHRIRTQILTASKGSFRWECEDVYGDTRTFELQEGYGIYMPPYIFDRYTALEEDSEVTVICNTLFNPDDERTHDTFDEPAFRAVQDQYR